MTTAAAPCVALVTGAAGGIGAAVCARLRQEDWRVIATDIREGDAAGDEDFLHLDVTRSDEWADVVAKVVEHYGRIDVLVNVAGVFVYGGLEETTDDTWARVVAINQTGTFYGIRAVAPVMRVRGSGSIVNVSSIAGLTGLANAIPYVATKFAVTGMTKVAALELLDSGVRVNSVHPGSVDTAMASGPAPIGPDRPVKRVASAAQIAEVIHFLASEASSFCTGSEFVADGGRTAGIHRIPGSAADS